ncbi:MAG: hypothetical protein ACFE9O_10980 [Promethearchaeota archaeon]
MTRIKLMPLTLLAFLLIMFASPFILTQLPTTAGMSNSTALSHRSSPMNYDFRILNETVQVLPQIDASAIINYSITFENYGTDFDYIDIGLPNSYYVLSSFRAYWSLNNAPYVELSVATSEAVDIGIEIFIPPALRPGNGENGTIIAWGNQQRMVYLDTDPATPGYVGYEFVPTWFGSSYNRGTDYLGCHLHFPNGFNNGTLAKYHYTAPTTHYWTNTNLVYLWEYTNLANYQGLPHGISFPYDESYITTYFTTGGGIDWGNIFEEYFDIIIFGVIAIIIFGACCLSITRSVRAGGTAGGLVKRGYLPPAVKVEALGVRRGLTVVEAAVLNEVPLNRVFTMIVFGLLKKELITIQREGKAKPTFHTNQATIANAASSQGRFHYYERLFIKAITPQGNLDKPAVRTMLNTLIKTTARKLEGYSRTDTKAFYTRMIDQAWRQIGQATTPDAQVTAINDYAEWLLLTPDYDHRIKPYHHYYVPGWYWWWIWASHPRPHTLTPTIPAPTIRPTTAITLTDFANATVTGTQHFANNVVTGFQNLANQIATAFRPPPPPPPRSSFSGRSCACACACVSCACACAGGGR